MKRATDGGQENASLTSAAGSLTLPRVPAGARLQWPPKSAGRRPLLLLPEIPSFRPHGGQIQYLPHRVARMTRGVSVMCLALWTPTEGTTEGWPRVP